MPFPCPFLCCQFCLCVFPFLFVCRGCVSAICTFSLILSVSCVKFLFYCFVVLSLIILFLALLSLSGSMFSQNQCLFPLSLCISSVFCFILIATCPACIVIIFASPVSSPVYIVCISSCALSWSPLFRQLCVLLVSSVVSLLIFLSVCLLQFFVF